MQFSTVITHARNEVGKFAEAHARNDLTKPPFYALLLLPFRAFVGRSTTLLLSCCYFSVAFRWLSVGSLRKGGNNCSTYVVPIFTIYPWHIGGTGTERGLYTRTYLGAVAWCLSLQHNGERPRPLRLRQFNSKVGFVMSSACVSITASRP